LVDDPGQPPAPGPAAFPDDWREQIAGEDTAMLNELKRVESVAALAKRVVDQRAVIAKGLKPMTITSESTDEEIAAYREAVGIPTEVDQYNVQFSENITPSERDTALLGTFKEAAHGANLTEEQSQGLLLWYEDVVEAEAQDRAEQAVARRNETSEALREEWGGDYAGNLNAVKTFMQQNLGEEAQTELAQMQFVDGTYLGDNVHFLRLLAPLAVDMLGPNAILAGDTTALSDDLNTRKEEILKLRGGNKEEREKYKSDAIQRELAGIYEKLNRIGQNAQ